MNHPEPDPLLIQRHFKDDDLEGLVIGNIGSGTQDVVLEETSGSGNVRTSVKTPFYARLVSRKTGQELADVVSAIARSLERQTGEKPRVWTRIMKRGSPLAEWYNPFFEKEFYQDMQGEKTMITQCGVKIETEKAEVVMWYKYFRAFEAVAGMNGLLTVYGLLSGWYAIAAMNGMGMLAIVRGNGTSGGTIKVTYHDPALRDWAKTAVKAFH